MESFSAILDGETVTIVNVDVNFPDVLISYIDSNGKLMSKTKTISFREAVLGKVL